MDWWQIVLIVVASIVTGLLVGGLLSFLVLRLLKRPFLARHEATAVFEEPLRSAAPVPVAELIRKREMTEQQARREAEREAKQARQAKEAEERERKKVVRQAKKQAEREAKEARKAQEAEEQRMREAVRQAANQAEREAEEARKAREAQQAEERESKAAAVVGEELELTVPDLVAEVENNRRIAIEPWTGNLVAFQTGVWEANRDEVHTLPASLREDLNHAYLDMRLANSIVWLSTELGRRSPNLDDNYVKLCTSIAAKLDKVVSLLKQSGD